MSAKKILLVGFIFVLLAAIPLTVYLVQQEQKTKSGAQQKTTLSLIETPQTVQKESSFKLDAKVNPIGINQVSFVKFTITYDSDFLATESAGTTNCPSSPDDAFCSNTAAFPIIMQGPTYEDGKVSVTLSVGNDPAKAVKVLSTAGTIYLKTKDKSGTTTVAFEYDPNSPSNPDTQVLSIGSNDQFNENVVLNAIPAQITIPGETTTDTGTPTDTPTPTGTPTDTPTDTPTPTPGQTTTGPSCTSLTADPSNSGTAPLNINLTANGQSSDSTISKLTFNFGDGQTQDVTDSSAGIGTNSISVLQSHTYSNPGNYTATAVLTDASGNVSPIGNCSIAISVNNGTTNTTTTTTTTENNTVVITATPTIASVPLQNEETGPKDLITIGSIGALITAIGAILFLAL
jgi:hypothetical protein